MNRLKRVLLTAGVLLAMAFTFSCTSDLETGTPIGDDEKSSPSGNSSSSFNNNSNLNSSSSLGLSFSSSSINAGTSSSSLSLSSSSLSAGISSSSSSFSSSSLNAGISSSSSSLSSSSLNAGISSSSSSSFSSSSINSGISSSSYGKASIDGYKTVVIGTQTWMAENLNYDVPGSLCYDNLPSNCDTYGRLYNWDMAMSVCPSGWHLPSNTELEQLLRFVDGNSGVIADGFYVSTTAGNYLKATNGWGAAGNGQDTHGFTALPGGAYVTNNSGSRFEGGGGAWWSSTNVTSNGNPGAYGMVIKTGYPTLIGDAAVVQLYSVRCVKD